MTRQALAGVRFRQRKLSTKQSLQVLTENQVEKLDDDQQRNIPKVDTGVEKGEEVEHHLQAAISASQAAAVGGKVAQIYIPTPDTIQSNIQYDRFYPPRFQQPATYVRFSSTVEDCSGTQYCMSTEDDKFLKALNQNKAASTACTEDQFEEVMDCFEQVARTRQPFAAIDSPPVVSFEEMESFFEEKLHENIRTFAQNIYEHWKRSRLRHGNKSLMPSLKFEVGQESDDSDPYVCFRRREVRQVRKTRGRDAQSTEKLRRLRKELDDARHLLSMVHQREKGRKEILSIDKVLFEQRCGLKASKRRLGIKGEDEDLVNQKPQKKKALENLQNPRPSGPATKLSSVPNGRSAETDLVSLHETLIEKENELHKEIEQKLAQHRQWSSGFVDFTTMPLTAPSEDVSESEYRTVVIEYLPTPPESLSDASGEVDNTDMENPAHDRDDPVVFRYAPPSNHGSEKIWPSFRRRIGRGGRQIIDRRGLLAQPIEEPDMYAQDRFKYDRDDDDEQPVYPVEAFEALNMRYRASFTPTIRDHAIARQNQMQKGRVGQREAVPVSGQSSGAARPASSHDLISSQLSQGQSSPGAL
ncbi:MAG: hypothetical protein M1825_000017 [Sarcosagium campestre]|nr:MAG: hypothetical protein M1825_000017 [Sarcosagium campestre]